MDPSSVKSIQTVNSPKTIHQIFIVDLLFNY